MNMNEELKKALETLIEETMVEIDELKKSSKFAASEIKIEGPGDGIAGKPSDGHLGKDEDDDEDEDEDKDMDKGEGKNCEADPNAGHHQPAHMGKDEGKNLEADPNHGNHKPAHMGKADDHMDKAEDKKKDKKDDKKDEPHKDDPKHEEKEKKMAQKLLDMHKDEMGYMKGAIKKSDEEFATLMKSMVDERINPLEQKLSSILELVNRIADQPVAPKGVTAKMQPLSKSAEGEYKEPLSKSEVSSKLFELKKSGTQVESLDVTKAELGQDLQAIVKKYNLA